MPGYIYRKILENPRITEVAITHPEIEDITTSNRDAVHDIERDDINKFEKRLVHSMSVEKKAFEETENLTSPEKVSS